MEATYNVVLVLAFADATSRTVTFKGVEEEAINNVTDKVKALNANIPESFATTFVSAIGAHCTMISKAQIVSIEEEVIYSAS